MRIKMSEFLLKGNIKNRVIIGECCNNYNYEISNECINIYKPARDERWSSLRKDYDEEQYKNTNPMELKQLMISESKLIISITDFKKIFITESSKCLLVELPDNVYIFAGMSAKEFQTAEPVLYVNEGCYDLDCLYPYAETKTYTYLIEEGMYAKSKYFKSSSEEKYRDDENSKFGYNSDENSESDDSDENDKDYDENNKFGYDSDEEPYSKFYGFGETHPKLCFKRFKCVYMY